MEKKAALVPVSTEAVNKVNAMLSRMDNVLLCKPKLKMSNDDFMVACMMIATASAKAQFNTCVKDNMSNTYDILILDCAPALISELIAAGYHLGMTEKGLAVYKF